MREETVTKHEAFGNIQISRVQGATALYDSPLRHQNYIALRIHKAESVRSIGWTRHHPHQEIIEVLMSEVQFAQAITGMGSTGTPCTLSNYRDPVTGERVRPDLKHIDLPSHRQVFDDEVKETIAKVERQIRDLRESVKADIEKLPKKTQESILNKISAIDNQLQTLPYIQERFYETMDKTVMQAKTEVYASVNAMIQQKGLEALGIAPVLMLEDDND